MIQFVATVIADLRSDKRRPSASVVASVITGP